MFGQIMDEILTPILQYLTRRLTITEMVRISTVIFALFRYDSMNDNAYVKDALNIRDEYDFVVIGSGAGGAVIASRLSENPSWNVLILEAGGNENELTTYPALYLYQLRTSIDWNYQTEPSDEYCLAMEGNRCNWSRGKILGGTTAINAMLYVRGNKNDYDHWESLGNTGWGFEEALYYFLKSEDNKNAKYLDTRYHTFGGPLPVQESKFKTKIADAFMEAGRDFGYETRDINGDKQSGFMLTQATMKDGERCSSARAFLRPARLRSNLDISMNAHVTKLVVDAVRKETKGVEFVKNGKKYRIGAKKEVILSAGAIASPQILMLSGIGPREHLQQLSIPVLQDLKVGHNLQDHYGLAGMTFTVTPKIAVKVEDLVNATQILRYAAHKSGPIAALSAEALAFVNTRYANASADWPDIQFDFAPYSMNIDTERMIKLMNFRRDFFDKMYRPLGDRDAFVILPNIMRPKSRGFVRLRSNDPFEHPKIVPNYYQSDEDVRVLIEGIRLALDFVKLPSFRKLNATYWDVPVPGCENREYGSDRYWECALRHVPATLWHFSGTCKMGPDADPDSVVDPRLRVRGVKNLRVVDASVMPQVTTGNIMAPVYMIAEKASDMIKEDWSNIDIRI